MFRSMARTLPFVLLAACAAEDGISTGDLGDLEGIEELLAAQGQRIIVIGVNREMRRKISKLRAGAGVRMGAHDDRE